MKRNIRSLLFIPGNSTKMLDKMFTVRVKPDAFVPDLEDSVPLDAKDEARLLVKDFIKDKWISSHQTSLLIPRVNATLGHNVLYEDLRAVSTKYTYAITFGKAETEQDVKLVSDMLNDIESENKIEHGSIKLIPWIETALGIVNAYQICSCDPNRVIAVAFGADDYAASMGFSRDPSQHPMEKELEYPRNVIAVAATASNIMSLDTPNVNFKQDQSTIEESKAVKQMGFRGKFAIHPNQVQHLNTVFGISDEEYNYAKRVVDAYNTAAASDSKRGSTQVDGRMIDMPVFKRYQQVLERAKLERELQ
jgi:citrate lyase subunit beta/citryl-CoA lyase